MRQITAADIARLLAAHDPPCISLYQPTHRQHPDSLQNPIRYRNLLRELEKSLRQKYEAREVERRLERFEALAHDEQFWGHPTDGLAILSDETTFEVFELQRSVPELLIVADSFHLKPLLRIAQSADRYQILCLNRQSVRLYEGNRDALDPVLLTQVPATITEALGAELTEPYSNVSTYGYGPSGPRGAMHHGHGSKKDEVDVDVERFFRVIDRAVLEHHSRPTGLPLMLAALAEYHAPFRDVSHNPHLMDEGIMANPDALSTDELRAEAWRLLEPRYLRRLEQLVSDFQGAASRALGSDDIPRIAEAAMAGRVGTLLVDAERDIPGRLLPDTGQVELGANGDPHTDDVLDDLAELTLRMKGEVVVVPADRMPTDTGVAATFRF
jgi:hypothetical protein